MTNPVYMSAPIHKLITRNMLKKLGLIALLEQAGVSVIDATGTTLLYRFLTWFLPMIVGSLLWWQYSRTAEPADSREHLHV